jgi:hypothetical protein
MGDHVAEGEAYIRACEEQNGSVVGAPDLRKRRSPHGWSVTVLAAANPWWREHMSVHGQGWTAMPDDRLSDFLDQRQP